MRILLRDLTPGTPYAVQLRATSPESVSEWSRLFALTTMTDNVAPDVPSWITPHIDAWKADGDTFVAQWEPLNLTLPQNLDFDHYELVLSDGVTEATIKTQNNAHVLTFDQNRSLFGTESATVTAKVRAVDDSGNTSAFTDTLSATNPVPGPPTAPAGGVATEGVSEVALDWVEPTGADDTDIVRYRVWVGTDSGFTPGPSNIVYSGLNTHFTYKTATAVEHFFKIKSVDKFGQESTHLLASGTPESPFGGDTTPPDEPTDLAGTITNDPSGVGAIAEIEWVFVAPPADLAGFYVRYRKVGDTNWSSTTFQSEERAGTIELQAAYTDYEFQIKAFDWANNESAWEPVSPLVVTSPSNTVPSTVTGVVGAAGLDAIRWTWDPVTDSDLKDYEFQIAEDSGFTVGVVTFLNGTSNVINTGGLDSETQYWARVRARDTQDAVSAAWSSVATATTLVVTEDMIQSLSVSKLTTGTLDSDTGIINLGLGASIVVNGGYLKSTNYEETVYTPTADSGWYIGEDGIVIADGAISANSFTGGTFNAGDIVLAAGGAIVGGGWTLDETGLDIPDGGISAASLNLQIGNNILPQTYSDFEIVGVVETAIHAVSDDTVSLAVVSPGRFNDKALEVTFTNGSGDVTTVWLSSATDSYNIPVEPGQEYIFSGYFWNPTAEDLDITFVVTYPDDSESFGGGAVTADTEASAVRLSNVFVVPAGQYSANISITCSDVVTVAELLMDGMMVELKTSNTQTPSPWNPGSATYINGGSIKTGSIRSNNYLDDDTATPMWAINLDGSATFSHLKVLGTSVLGMNETDDQSLLQSSNYETGVSGWMVRGDGVAEFRQVVAGSMNPDVLGGGIMGQDPEDFTKYVIELRGALEAYGYESDGITPNDVTVGISADGFYSTGPDDNGTITPFVSFPTASGKPNIISGELDAQSLTVNNGATMYGANVFQKASTIVLESSVVAPTNPPSYVVDWANTALAINSGRGYQGFTQGHDGTYSADDYNYVENAGGPYVTTRVWKRFGYRKWNTSTGAFETDELLFQVLVSQNDVHNANRQQTNGNVTNYGMTYIPSFLSGGGGAYVFIWREWGVITENNGLGFEEFPINYDRIKARVFDTSFNDVGAEHTIHAGTGARHIFSVGRDFTNNRLLVSWRNSDTGNYSVQPFNMTGSALTSFGGAVSFDDSDLTGAYLVGFGTFDFGASRYVFADNTTKINKVFNSSSVAQVAEHFTMANNTNMRGTLWNTTTSQFQSFGYDYKRYTYYGGSNNWLTGTATAQWRFKYTWWDDNAGGFGGDYETLPSPASADITMHKRARLSITHPTIPFTEFADISPDRSRIYRSVFSSGVWGTYAYAGGNAVGGLTWQMLGTTISFGNAPNTDITTQFPVADDPAKMTMGGSAFIDGTGLVISNNPVYKQVTHPSTAQTFTSTGVWRAVTLQDYAGGLGSSRGNIATELVNNPNTSSTTPTIVIAVEGWYFVSGGLTFTNSATAGRRNLQIERFTGAATEGTGEQVAWTSINAAANAFGALDISGMVYCEVGDRLRLIATHNAPASLATVAGTGWLHVAMV